jgi:hypothetical protein
MEAVVPLQVMESSYVIVQMDSWERSATKNARTRSQLLNVTNGEQKSNVTGRRRNVLKLAVFAKQLSSKWLQLIGIM